MAHKLPKKTFFNTAVRPVDGIAAPVVGADAIVATGDTIAAGTVVAVSSTGRIVTVLVDGVKVKFTYSATSRRFINMDLRTDRVATFA